MATFFRENVVWNVCDEIKEAKRILEKYLAAHDKDLKVLSANDSQHGPGSLHPLGKAIDIRRVKSLLTKDIIFNLIKHLGFLYKDIIVYDWGFHIELDIKKK